MPSTLPAPEEAAAPWAAASEATYEEAAKLCCALTQRPSKPGSVLASV